MLFSHAQLGFTTTFYMHDVGKKAISTLKKNKVFQRRSQISLKMGIMEEIVGNEECTFYPSMDTRVMKT